MKEFNAVLGLDWMRSSNPHIDWDSSALSIKRNGATHKVYPQFHNQLLQDHVFVQILDSNKNKHKFSGDEVQFWLIHNKPDIAP